MELRNPATLVEELPEFEWDGEFFFARCPTSGVRRAFTEARFCETLARMAAIVRSSRIGGRLSAQIVAFPKGDRAG